MSAAHAAEGHVSHTKTYVKVFVALAVLTVIEVAVPFVAERLGTHGDAHVALGLTWSRTALLFLAGAKASLVGLFFMHLIWETRWVRFIALMPASLAFYAVFLIAEAVYRAG